METAGSIFISAILLEELGAPKNDFIKIRIGQITINTRLLIKEGKRKYFILSPSLASKLFIKNKYHLKIRYDSNNKSLHIGPIIGIFCTSIPYKQDYDPNSIQAELIFLSKITRTFPACIYIFTAQSINWGNRSVRGYQYKQITPDKGIWTSSIFPLPDVVYDRIASRLSESKPSIKSTKKMLRSFENLYYFNPSFLNKWKVHELLSLNYDLVKYLPETMILNKENLDIMLSKYGVLYIKPENGSLGKGIIKLNKQGEKLKYIMYGQRINRGIADNSEEFLKRSYKFRNNRPYIVQQGLDLQRYKGAPFDIRIIFQKNFEGKWKISKKFVRVAAHGRSIANLSSGGSAETSKKILRKVVQRKNEIEKINTSILELCTLAAETLEKNSRECFGELGLDLGIDKNLQIWLIEINSKPRKTTETELSQIIVKNTFRNPLLYSIHLAGFT